MTSITSVSPTELRNRRQELKRRRRLRCLQGIWRSLLVSSMAGGLIWVVTLPNWVIRQPEQIDIEGNQLLSAEAIRSLLPLSYPQSILQIEPYTLSQKLEYSDPIAEARVTRQILPPSLTVDIKERQPVAVVQLAAETEEAGFLDEQGVWIAKSSYADIEEQIQKPELKVIGNSREQFSYWPQMYQVLRRSTVAVSVVDYQNPSNIILETELGTVHIGLYTSQFSEQLRVLAQMRHLNSQVEESKIDYIDLSNPHKPSIQLKQASGD